VTARALGSLALAVSMGLASPWWRAPPPAAPAAAASAPDLPGPTPEQRLHDAVESAARRHVPGAAGEDWRLDRIDVSDIGDGGVQHIVASGLLASAGDVGTKVRLSGRYDSAAGELSRVSYRLLPASRPLPEPGPAWNLQQAVQQSLAKAHPGVGVSFALDSAQGSRLERGGRRFEGFGLAVVDGETRFVAFTLDLSAQGQSLAFDFGPEDLAVTTGPGLAAASVGDRD
jgi:hypothetical protein